MITIKKLSFGYNKSTPPQLKDVSLHIPKGTYLSIVGENGSGKSTLVKLILGLLKPQKGSISLDTTKVSYVPQRLDGFNSQFPISILEILKVHARTLNLNPKQSAIEALEKTNMIKFKEKLIGSLSGGQQQRVFIARALLGSPELIILDEPSTGVDAKNQEEIYTLLSKINKEQGTTIISIEHNMNIALKYSSHILTLNKGHATLLSNEDFHGTACETGA